LQFDGLKILSDKNPLKNQKGFHNENNFKETKQKAEFALAEKLLYISEANKVPCKESCGDRLRVADSIRGIFSDLDRAEAVGFLRLFC
jgi:hypothetical protein